MAAAKHDVNFARECVVGGSWRHLMYIHVEKVILDKLGETNDFELLAKYEDIMGKIGNSRLVAKKDLDIRFSVLLEGIHDFQETFWNVPQEIYGGWEIDLVNEIKGLLFANYAYLSKKYSIGSIYPVSPGVYGLQETGVPEKLKVKKFHLRFEEFLASKMKKGNTQKDVAEEVKLLLGLAKELCSMEF